MGLFELLLLDNPDARELYFYVDLFFVFVIGLCFGSFASAIIYRIPLGQSWAASKERSACPACGSILGSRDLIPLFSWLLTKGKCRYCSAEISPIYPALELLTAITSITIFLFYSGDIISKYLFILSVPFLISLLAIDLKHKILPNQLVLIVGGIGLLVMFAKAFNSDAQAHQLILYYLSSSVVFALFSYALGMIMKWRLKRDALGLGDVKFFGVAGLWLGLSEIAMFCMMSGILGIILAVIWKAKTGQDVFPFGPALILSFFLIFLMDGSFFL